MAARLRSSGHSLTVADANPSAVSAFLANGGRGANTPAELASRTTIVFCSLPTPAVVETVLVGKNGLIDGGAVKIVVDFSTTGPQLTASLAKTLETRGIALVDAPVSGGVTGAEAGTLSIMTSGPASALDAVDPMLRMLGKNIFRLGDAPGLGQQMKLVNNMLLAANAVASFEAMVVGVKGGLDATRMLEVLNASSGRSFVTTDKLSQCVLNGSFPMRFATELLHKDVRLGVEEAERVGAPLWMMYAVKHFLTNAMADGAGTTDYCELIRRFEHWAGVEVRATSAAPTRIT